MLPIVVVNNHGQFNNLISRALRDNDIESVLILNTTPPDEVQEHCRGIIPGGGPEISRVRFGLQWHPEVSYAFEAFCVFENFHRICKGET